MEELKEECGVFGIYDRNSQDISRIIFYALYALQHRGQESCGIVVDHDGVIDCCKEMGLVSETFSNDILDGLKGKIGMGHVRYSTAGASTWNNAQPIVVHYRDGMMAVAHNGNLVNAELLRHELCSEGSVFIANNDTELMVKLLSKYLVTEKSVAEAVAITMSKAKGAYAVTLMVPGQLVGFRDPHGIRPLCLGKVKDSYVISSESCAIYAVGGEFIRDVRPGEIVVIDEEGLHSYETQNNQEDTNVCIFEYVYFARPDSYVDGASVHRARLEAGRRLALESPVEADLVIGVPDSALSAAMGYSRQAGIPYGHGLIRNRYVGRTFIQPTQELRDRAVGIKFSVLKEEIKGKRIIMVDDSIVRGTTTRIIVQMLKDAGAKEVHLRISSPPVRYSCFYGIDTSTPSQLIAANFSVEEICQMVGADSLAYLSLEGLRETPVGIQCGLCDACFTGHYCVPPESICKIQCKERS